MKNYKELGIYDFTDYAEEITGDALFKINGGAEVQNSHQGDFLFLSFSCKQKKVRIQWI